VTCDDYDELQRQKPAGIKSNDSLALTSTWRALTCNPRLDPQALSVWPKTGPAPKLSENHISLSRFCREHGIEAVDFIKTDTDGHDYFVLRGADAILPTVLGLFVECNFHGESWDHGNNFANIDRLLRSRGFSLFDLSVWRYTRAALPGPFVYDLAAQTTTGQAQWGDALYFRDPCNDPDFLFAKPQPLRDLVSLKLLALYETFGFPDCVAQLLVLLRDRKAVPSCIPSVEQALDWLARGNPLGAPSHAEYLRRFEENPTVLFPCALRGWLRRLGSSCWHVVARCRVRRSD
jgi:hypothetical protein